MLHGYGMLGRLEHLADAATDRAVPRDGAQHGRDCYAARGGCADNYASDALSLPIISTTPPISGIIDMKTVETDGWPNSEDDFAYVTYQPNAVGPVPLGPADNGRGWELKEQPHVGPFDPVKVAVVYGWP